MSEEPWWRNYLMDRNELPETPALTHEEAEDIVSRLDFKAAFNVLGLGEQA